MARTLSGVLSRNFSGLKIFTRHEKINKMKLARAKISHSTEVWFYDQENAEKWLEIVSKRLS